MQNYQQLTENLTDLRVLGVDFGTKKLGFAILHWSLDEAVLPLGVVIKHKPDVEIISDVAKEHHCTAVVIGNCDNSSNLKTVVKLQEAIQKKLNIPVFLQDERLTTYAANEILKDIGMKRKDRNMVDDAVAAHLILEDFVWELKRYIHNR